MGSRTKTRSEALDALETQIAVLARRLEHASRRSAPHQPLDRAGYLLARTIDEHGPSSVNRLAQLLGLDGSTVTRQVATLVDGGFVDRAADPRDGRAAVVSLTTTGRRGMEQVRSRRTERIGGSVESWSTGDVATLAELLDRLNRSLWPT